MSEEEHWIGKLIPISFEGDAEPAAREELIELGILKSGERLPECYDDYLDMIHSLYYNEYYVFNNQLFKVEKEDSTDMCRVKKNEDGTFDFTANFYNGGACLSEVLDSRMEKL